MHEEATRIAAAGYPQNRQDIFMEHRQYTYNNYFHSDMFYTYKAYK